MEKFVLLDSNIYIHLCFVDLKMKDDGVLKKLVESLNGNKFKILLPEVIELEFDKLFCRKRIKIEAEVNKILRFVNQNKEIDSKKAKENLKLSITKSRVDTLSEVDKIKDEVKKIFNHKNTIQKELELTSLILLEAYKIFLQGEKPCKNNDGTDSLQADAMIIAAAQNYLKDQIDYELYLSSNNYHDFVEDPKETDHSKFQIAESIKKRFFHIKYFYETISMLNEVLGLDYSEQVKEEFEKSRVHTMNVNNTSVTYPISEELSVDNLFKNDGSRSSSIGVLTIERDLNSNVVLDESGSVFFPFRKSDTIRSCIFCHRSYFNIPESVISIDNGMCEACKKSGDFGLHISP